MADTDCNPPDYTIADHIERIETLELNGYNDKLRALNAELQLISAQFQAKQSEAAQITASRSGFVASLHRKYGLRPEIDAVSATGQITRAKPDGAA